MVMNADTTASDSLRAMTEALGELAAQHKALGLERTPADDQALLVNSMTAMLAVLKRAGHQVPPALASALMRSVQNVQQQAYPHADLGFTSHGADKSRNDRDKRGVMERLRRFVPVKLVAFVQKSGKTKAVAVGMVVKALDDEGYLWPQNNGTAKRCTMLTNWCDHASRKASKSDRGDQLAQAELIIAGIYDEVCRDIQAAAYRRADHIRRVAVYAASL
jgi:hypothetical protein